MEFVEDNEARTRIAELELRILSLEAGQLLVRDRAPNMPRNGLYYADGINWNPGAGRGVYRYDESTGTYIHLG